MINQGLILHHLLIRQEIREDEEDQHHQRVKIDIQRVKVQRVVKVVVLVIGQDQEATQKKR
jgi:hypothetical protein